MAFVDIEALHEFNIRIDLGHHLYCPNALATHLSSTMINMFYKVEKVHSFLFVQF